MKHRQYILLVDDREDNLLAMSLLLRDHGAECLFAQSGRDALEVLLTHDVALALIDVQLGEMDGFELAELMRGSVRTRDIPIIFVTGASHDSARMFKGYDVGAVDFLIKPLDPRVLANKARTFLRLQQQKDDLEEARRQLQAVMDAVPVGISFSNDPIGGRMESNPALLKQFSACAGDDVWSADFFTAKAKVSASDLPLERVVREGRPAGPMELQVRLANGRLWWAEVSAAPIHNASGSVVGGVAVSVDITERKRLEEALRSSEQMFRTLADNMSQLAWMADGAGTISWYNRRWLDYTGMALQDLIDVRWDSLLHPEHKARVIATLEQHLKSGLPWEETFPLRGRDGSYRWVLSRAVPIQDTATQTVHWFCTSTDITAQQEAKETLRRAVALRDEFLSVASHELRTPLTALGLQLEGLRRLSAQGRVDGLSDRAALKLDIAVQQGKRLNILVDGLFDVTRIESGRLALEWERFDLGDCINQVAERLIDVASRAGCELRVHGRRSVEGTWDRSRIDQVVMNLITNAIKYGAGHPVDVTLQEDGESVRIAVHDEGIGIAAPDQHRIFGRFERAVSPTRYGGLGLGLYISSQIVQAHGGTIEVESSVGKGSTFTVQLPRNSGSPLRAVRGSVDREHAAR